MIIIKENLIIPNEFFEVTILFLDFFPIAFCWNFCRYGKLSKSSIRINYSSAFPSSIFIPFLLLREDILFIDSKIFLSNLQRSWILPRLNGALGKYSECVAGAS